MKTPMAYAAPVSEVQLEHGLATVGSWISFNRVEHSSSGHSSTDRLVRESGVVLELWCDRHPNLREDRYYAEVMASDVERRVWLWRDKADVFGVEHMDMLF